jgi:hypothetical protein
LATGLGLPVLMFLGRRRIAGSAQRSTAGCV